MTHFYPARRAAAQKPPARSFMSPCTVGILLLALATFLSGSLFAQSGRSTISGRVVDPSGAVVAGAKVAVTNVETNFTVSLVANEKGYYEASQLNPGQYKITAEAAGFGTLVRQGITLVAGTPISIEMKLTVAKAKNETVVVTADAPLINADPGTNGQVLSNKTIDNTPVSGANASLLIKYAQGVTSNDATNRYMAGNLNATGNASGIGTAGQNGKNQFYLDGAPNESKGHSVAYSPSTDEVSEIKSETSGFDASIGKTLGVSVVATSKGGTNDFHGSVREMYYARRWQSMTHFGSTKYAVEYAKSCATDPSSAACADMKRNNGQPGLIEHNSGFNLGGPVIIPKVFNGKDKLFFFVNINRDKYGDARQLQSTVPTDLERKGDFSDLCAAGNPSNCGAYQIYNPLSVTYANGLYTRQPVAGNNLNNLRSDPRIASLMDSNKLAAFVNKYYPHPNTSSNGSYAIPSNYTWTQASPQLYTSYLLRTDFTPNQKDRFFLRLSKTNYNQDQNGFLVDDLDHRLLHDQSRILTGGWTHMLSTRAVLDSSIGYTQWSREQIYANLAKFGPADLGLPAYADSMASLSNSSYLPVINFGSTYSAFGTNPTPREVDRQLSARSNLSYIRGNHTFNMGGDVRQQMMSAQPSANTSGLITFGNGFTKHSSDAKESTQALGTQYASLLLGIPDKTQYDIPTHYKAHNPYWAWYVQDSWRASSKLTLSLGLRYEYEYGPIEATNSEVSYWDPTATQPIASVAQANYASLFNSTFQPAFANAGLPVPASTIQVMGGNVYAGVNGASKRRFDNNWRLMPRLGVAYQLTPTTVVRGGYGLFFDTTNVLNQSINQNGFSRSTSYSASTDSGLNWLMGNPSNGISPLSDPFYLQPSGERYLSPIGNSLGSSMYLGQSFTYYPKDYKPARQQRWQFEIQKQLGNRDAVTVGYTGSWTDRLEWSQNHNSVPESYYTGGTVQNPNATLLGSPFKGKNPFYYTNFASLQASNPNLYNLLASSYKSADISYATLAKPYPWMGDIKELTNKGASKFHSMNIQYNHRLSKGFQTTVNYQRTWQYDKDFTPNDFVTGPSWRLSDSSRPSRLTLTGRLELPFGKGQRWLNDGILSKIFGGQTLDFSYEAQQGELVDFGNIIYTGDPKNLKSVMLKHPVYVLDTATGDNYVQWLDPAVVNHDSKSQLTSYNLRQFPSRIDGVRQQGLNNFSVNYQRSISISERVKFIGRFEAIDVFNHRVVGSPDTSATNTKTYGRVTADGVNYSRWIQIQGKITF